MKRILFLILIILSSVNVNAADYKRCKELSLVAQAIMIQRQNNNDVVSVYKKYTEEHYELIYEAYKRISYVSDEFKQKAVIQFKNKKFTECMAE